MQLNTHLNYTIQLTAQEFRIVMSALRGELKDEWKAEAAELQNQLYVLRKKQTEQLLNQLAKQGIEP